MAPAVDKNNLEASNEGTDDENEEVGSNEDDDENEEEDSNEVDDQNEDEDENEGEENADDENDDSEEADDKGEVDTSKEGDSVEEVQAAEEGDDLDAIEMTLATEEFAELKESTVDTSSEIQDSKPKSPFACSLCKEMCKRASKMKCCGKKACRACAIKHVTGNRKCWYCGANAKSGDVVNDEELRAAVDKHQADLKEFMDGLKSGELLKCCVCQEICKRGVTTPCCGVPACRGCATKKITGSRGCWMEFCGKAGVKTEELVNDMVLREAVDGFKKDGVVNEELAREIKDKRDEMNPELIKAKEEERKKKVEEIKKKRKESFEARKRELVLKRLEEKEKRKPNGQRNGVKGKPAEKGVIDLRSKLKTNPKLGRSKDRPITSKDRSLPNRLKPARAPLTRTIGNRKRSHTPLVGNAPAFFSGSEFGQGPMEMDMGGPGLNSRFSAEEQTKMELMATIKKYKEALIEMGALDDMPKKQKFMPDRQESGHMPRDTGRGRMSKKGPLLDDSRDFNWENRKDNRRERIPRNEPDFRGSWGKERERDAERGRMSSKSRGRDWDRNMERDRDVRDVERDRMPRHEPGFSKERDAAWDDRRKNRDREHPRDLPSTEDEDLAKLRRDVMKLKQELKESQSSRRSYERELSKRDSPRKSPGRNMDKDRGTDWNSFHRDDHKDHGRHNREDAQRDHTRYIREDGYRDNGRPNREEEFQPSYLKNNGNVWKDTARDTDPWRDEGGMGGAMRERDPRDTYPSMDMDRTREPERYPLPWDKQSKYPTVRGDSFMDDREMVRNSSRHDMAPSRQDIVPSRQEILSSRQDMVPSRQEILSNRQEMMNTTKQFEVDPWVGNSSSTVPGKDLDLRSAPSSVPMNSYQRRPGEKSVFGLPPPVPAPYNRPATMSASFQSKQASSMYEKLSREIDDHISAARSNTGYDSMPSRYEPTPKATSALGYKSAVKTTSGFGSGYEPTPKTSSGYDASNWGYDAPKSGSFFDELKSREPRLALLEQSRDESRYGGSSRKDIPSLMDQPGYGGSSQDAYGGSQSFGISYPPPKPQRRF